MGLAEVMDTIQTYVLVLLKSSLKKSVGILKQIHMLTVFNTPTTYMNVYSAVPLIDTALLCKHSVLPRASASTSSAENWPDWMALLIINLEVFGTWRELGNITDISWPWAKYSMMFIWVQKHLT